MGKFLNCFGEKSLVARIVGKDEINENDTPRFKALSFYDFDEDKSLINGSGNSRDIEFNDDGDLDDDQSDNKSVDEGAIAILSMDEIRNMHKMQQNY